MTTKLNENQLKEDDCGFVYIRTLSDLEKVTSGKLVLLEHLGIAACTNVRDGNLEFSVDVPNRDLIVSLTGNKTDAILREPFLGFSKYETRVYSLADEKEYFSRLKMIEREERIL